MDSCYKPPKIANLMLNGFVHVLILLTIIATFFFLYVSNLAKNKFHNEIKSVLDDNLQNILEKTDKNKNLKKILIQLNPVIQKASAFYNKNTNNTNTENEWLMKSTIFFILFILMIIIIVLFIIKLFCQKIPFTIIIKENIILFTLIGTVEILFFMYIAKNFIPTKPSLVINTVLNSLKNSFN
jgi:hypothetical protein